GDVVLHQVVGRPAGEHDAVVVLPEAVAVRVVDVAVPDHGSVRPRQADGHARGGAVDLHVLHPAIGRVGAVDAAAALPGVATGAAALHPEALDPRPLDGGRGHPGHLGAPGLLEGPVQRRGQGEGVAGDGGDLDALAHAVVGGALEDRGAVALVHLGVV